MSKESKGAKQFELNGRWNMVKLVVGNFQEKSHVKTFH